MCVDNQLDGSSEQLVQLTASKESPLSPRPYALSDGNLKYTVLSHFPLTGEVRPPLRFPKYPYEVKDEGMYGLQKVLVTIAIQKAIQEAQV
jgi:hypothetical protein